MKEYRTKTGKRGVHCDCGRRALVTPSGVIFRHCDPVSRAWCELGGTKL